MPDAKNNAKATGDTHLPEVEDTPRARGGSDDLARDLENEGRPGQGENQAGFLKDKEGGLGKGKA